MKNNSVFIFLAISIYCVIINSLSFKSRQIQNLINLDRGKNSLTADYLIEQLPSIPNITITAIPLAIYKANYLLSEGRLDEVDKYVSEAINVNPHIFIGEYFKSKIYMARGKLDSAAYSAKKAFYGWPKNIDHYDNYLNILEFKRDTASLIDAFNYLTPDLKNNPSYFKNFYKSFNKVKLSYLIKNYNDLSPMPVDSIYGTWVRAYNFPGQVVYDSTLIYSFKKPNILQDVDSLKYNFKLKNDSLFFLFTNNQSKPFMSTPIRYSDSYKTFVLYNVPIDRNTSQTQHFRKVE